MSAHPRKQTVREHRYLAVHNSNQRSADPARASSDELAKAQFGPHRSYAGESGGSEQFRGARFGEVDLRGARTHNSPDPRWLHADHA
jgi:hypothetical protein